MIVSPPYEKWLFVPLLNEAFICERRWYCIVHCEYMALGKTNTVLREAILLYDNIIYYNTTHVCVYIYIYIYVYVFLSLCEPQQTCAPQSMRKYFEAMLSKQLFSCYLFVTHWNIIMLLLLLLIITTIIILLTIIQRTSSQYYSGWCGPAKEWCRPRSPLRASGLRTHILYMYIYI